MYAMDFTYDGVTLSSLGYIVCTFDKSGNLDTSEAIPEISFTLSSMHSGKRQVVAGSQYDKCLTTKFQICKDPATHTYSQMAIEPSEFRALSRWLNRRQYLWFHNYDSCATVRERPWVRATFTLTRIQVDGVTYGVELDMTTDSPFGYGEERTETLSFTAGSLSKTITDQNDEIGECYPLTTITCGQAGKITLANAMTGCSTEVDNCANGEVITLSGDTMIISTSNAAHDLADDFNYDFFRIGNTYASKTNTITANRPCTVVLKYRPIYKDTI